MRNDEAFSHYAQDRLSADAFNPDFEKPAEQVFAASLDSFRALFDGIDMTDQQGAPMAILPGYNEKITENAFADEVERHRSAAKKVRTGVNAI